MKRFSVAALLVVAIGLGLAGGASAQTDPGSVARALIDAENAHNVDAAVAFFADDAVVTLPTGQFTTRDQIRGWQSELAAGNFKATIGTPQVSGERVTFSGSVELDTFRNLGIERMDSNWDITVQQGKVKTFTFTFTAESGARLQAALAPPAPSQPIARTGASASTWALGAGLAVLAGAMLVAVGRRRPDPRTS